MNQEIQSILAKVDHTLLAQSATWNEIKAICDDGVKYGCASVCIPCLLYTSPSPRDRG